MLYDLLLYYKFSENILSIILLGISIILFAIRTVDMSSDIWDNINLKKDDRNIERNW